MPFRFIHTADIHLDSPLKSLALRNPDLANLIGAATRTAFSRTVDLARDKQVDALLIAGDLYDGAQTSMKTALFLSAELARLHEAGIKTFLIRGNHDAASRITCELTLPDSVTTFSGRAEAVTLETDAPFDVAVHGISFNQPHAPESLLDKFKPPVEGAINIAMLHTSLGGAPGHNPYAPCQPAELEAMGFDYWALGHIHQRSVQCTKATIVMPGIPQGRDIGEAGAKSVNLVTISDDCSITVKERVIAPAQFERVAIDLTGIEDWADMVAALERALRAARTEAVCDHLVARLDLSGETPLAWRLRRDTDLLASEAEAIAGSIDGTWIDKVANACRLPAGSANTGEETSGAPVHELRALIDEEILKSPSFRTQMADLANALTSQLPGEVRAHLGEDEAAREALLDALAAEGAEDVLARLQAVPGPEDE
ncbi:DNA repair exonuclease [Breoghania sp.]|uniref:metallophosphoesterase family protein n=1 Tax=Breoghania sp. TaxID=2065378 RepID=UPI00261FAF5E|nr:DNA repair exonuclease [Breoghania sp.]MDJ0932950.1 DNA repair exonuclease [Breoghania sp.]